MLVDGVHAAAAESWVRDVFSTPLMCPHCNATRLPVSEATEDGSVVLTMLIESMPGRRYLVPSECVPTVFGSSGSTPAR